MFGACDTKFPQILSAACKTVVEMTPGRGVRPPKGSLSHTGLENHSDVSVTGQ